MKINYYDKIEGSQFTPADANEIKDAVNSSDDELANKVDKITGSRLVSDTEIDSWNNKPSSVSKSDVGLGNVDNTSDINKPISTSTQAALDGKQPLLNGNGLLKMTNSSVGYVDPSIFVTLVNGKIPLSEIPTSEVTSGTPTLGESFGGGKIFHILISGETGYESGKTKVLIAANVDVSTSVKWSYPSLYDSEFGIYRQQSIGTTLDAIGEGKNNTDELLALLNTNVNPAADNNYAIKLARSYTGGGFSDWSLPSFNEQVALRTSGVITGFVSNYYWTSSETNDGNNNTKFANPVTGSTGSGDRAATLAVRPIRMAEYSVTDGVVLKSDIISGSGSGTGTTTTITIGSTLSNNTYKVHITPTSANIGNSYVTNKTTTTFDVMYVNSVVGTGTFDWTLFK